MTMIDRTLDSRAAAHRSGILDILRASFVATVRFFRNRFAIKEMAELDDALLKDIGLNRHDIDRAYFSSASHDPMSELKQAADKRAQRMIV